MYIPDNYDAWEAHEMEQDEWLRRCPICTFCEQPIQDEKLFDINGELYHISCAEEEFMKRTEDYIE